MVTGGSSIHMVAFSFGESADACPSVRKAVETQSVHTPASDECWIVRSGHTTAIEERRKIIAVIILHPQ